MSSGDNRHQSFGNVLADIAIRTGRRSGLLAAIATVLLAACASAPKPDRFENAIVLEREAFARHVVIPLFSLAGSVLLYRRTVGAWPISRDNLSGFATQQKFPYDDSAYATLRIEPQSATQVQVFVGLPLSGGEDKPTPAVSEFVLTAVYQTDSTGRPDDDRPSLQVGATGDAAALRLRGSMRLKSGPGDVLVPGARVDLTRGPAVCVAASEPRPESAGTLLAQFGIAAFLVAMDHAAHAPPAYSGVGSNRGPRRICLIPGRLEDADAGAMAARQGQIRDKLKAKLKARPPAPDDAP